MGARRDLPSFPTSTLFRSVDLRQDVHGAALWFAAEQQGRIAGGGDGQPHAAPFDGVPFAADQIDDRAHWPAVAVRADGDVAAVEPEGARPVTGERNGDTDR